MTTIEKKILSLLESFSDKEIDSMSKEQLKSMLSAEETTFVDKLVQDFLSRNEIRFEKESRPTVNELYFEMKNIETKEKNMRKTSATKEKLSSYFDSDFFKSKKISDNEKIQKERNGAVAPRSETAKKLDKYFEGQ